MIAAPAVARTFALLLAAVLLPLVAFALLTQVGDHTRQHRELNAALAERAAQYASGVMQRLLLADAALGVVAARPREGDEPHAGSGEGMAEFFSAIGLIDFSAQSAQPSGLLPAIPPLTVASRLRLERGLPVIVLAADASATPRVLLLRGSRHGDGTQGALAAALNPAYLWGVAGNLAAGTRVHVLGADGQVLHAAAPDAGDPRARFRPGDALAVAGAFEWEAPAGRQAAGYHRIPIADGFALPDLTLVVSRPVPQPLGDVWLFVALALALLLAVPVAAWLQRRAPGLPASQDADHAVTPASGDMAPIKRADAPARTQSDLLRALAEIDQAILSRAGIDRIMEIVMRKVGAALLNCDLVAVSSRQPNTERQIRTVSRVGDGALSIDHDVLPESLATTLAEQPNGCWLEDAADYPFLARLAAAGTRRFLVLPVYCDSRLAGVLSLGGFRVPPDEEALAPARQFAGRLAVAFTAFTRAEEVYLLGHFDSMTGLPNRRYFRKRLSEEISRAVRDKSALALLYIDLDQFKRVNDGAGHEVGDIVLTQVSARLREHLRNEDVLAHFGGDEFVLLLPALPSATDAGRVAEKLIALLSQPFFVEGGEHRLSASIGIGIYPNDGHVADVLLQNTDSAMSLAKKAGRSRYMFFEERVNVELSEQFAVETELHRAIAESELVLFYQPQIDLRSGKIVGAEALIRWQHPKRGLLPPSAFIDIAEKSGLIEQIGAYTRRTACEQYRSWESCGIVLERLSVNLSSRELNCRDFVETLEATLTECGVRPFALEIEITEGTLLEDSEQVMLVLRALRERGIRLAIDDFGTGYSSLSYLKRMPFDLLKVDQSFIIDIGSADDSESRAVASAIIGIAHSLGKEVCAEGVENEAHLDYMAECDCELIQGYLISRPLPAKDFEAFVRNWGEAGISNYRRNPAAA